MKTISQKYQEQYYGEKRKKIILRLTLWAAVSGGVAGGLVYLLFFASIFDVRQTSLINHSSLDPEAIQPVVKTYLAEKKWGIRREKNIFLVDKSKLSSRLVKDFPALRQVLVRQSYWHTLVITLEPRVRIGTWCFQSEKNCLAFDWEGVAFEMAGTGGISVEDNRDEKVPPGSLVAEASLLVFIEELNKTLPSLNLEVEKIIIPPELFRVNVKTKEGWELYLSTSDNLANQLKTLSIFLANKLTPEQRGRLKYLDLRLPGRVYFK